MLGGVCGRYASTRRAQDIADEFDAIDLTSDEPLRPSYNVAPTDTVHIVRRSRRAENRVVQASRWGLIPSWANDPSIGARMINARAESLAEKPAFRAAFERRRCLVPADGWYEWARYTDRPGKQPYLMTTADGSGLVFAGLWEVWGTGEQMVFSCTVVTTPAVGRLTAIHDRMPLVLPPHRWGDWLGESAARRSVAELLEPSPLELAESLEVRPVGAAVGNVRNNGPELMTRVEIGRPEPVPLDDALF